MFQKALSYLQYGNTFCGLEITSKAGKDVMYAMALKKQKNALTIGAHSQEFSMAETANKFPKKAPVFLIINNQQVLTKQVDSELTDPLKLVHKAFPNINLSDFIYEVLVQDRNHHVSICRREYVESLLKSSTDAGLSIVNISLGNLLVSTSLQFLNDTTIWTSNAQIQSVDNQVHRIEAKDSQETVSYHLNGLDINKNYLLSVLGALDIILVQYAPISNFEPEKNKLLVIFRQTRIFGHAVKGGLMGLFLVLLINFLIYSSYFNKVQELQQASHINQDSKSRLVQLNEKVNRSQKMVEDIFKNNASKTSYYTNSIIQSLPSTILLDELNYQPLLKKIRADKPIESKENILVLNGESVNSSEFSEWLLRLEHLDWVKKFEVLDYTDISGSQSRFSIEIQITND